MALSDGGEWVPNDVGIESFQLGDIQWSHPTVPYLQLIEVVISLADGRSFSLLSQHEDGTGTHGAISDFSTERLVTAGRLS